MFVRHALDDNLLRRWLRDQNITNRAAVADIVALRGKVAALNLLDDRCRIYWAHRLREIGCDYLILDCLRPVLDAIGLDEHRDGGRFLIAFDRLLDEAGINNALMVQHMGHTGERSRGDSRFQDWPDAIWRVVRENDDPASARFFSAYGRDVDIHEGRLSLDAATRHLAYVSGSRKDSKVEAAEHDVIKTLAEHHQRGGQPLSGRQLEQLIVDLPDTKHGRQHIRDAIKNAASLGHVAVEPGPNNGKFHRIANPCNACGYPLTSRQDDRHMQCRTAINGAA